MGVYVTKDFTRFARRARLSDAKLLEAAREVAAGQFDADLGAGVFKQRIAREGGGKSGGFRTIVVFRCGADTFFVHGFAKNDKANVSTKELAALKKLAGILLSMSRDRIEIALKAGELTEVASHGDS